MREWIDIVIRQQPLREDGPLIVGSDLDLFEMANLDPSQTGIEGTIHISTQQAGHAPRVKYYAARPGANRPSMSVTVAAKPEIIENSLPPRVANQMGPMVQAWVALNHRELREFWFKGNTWYHSEVNAFIARLKRFSA
jgi:hypothetical protein